MTDRKPGAPGQYKAVIAASEFQKLQTGENFTITLTRDDQPITEGTPYNKASVLPDELAAILCPNIEDPAPADALESLMNRTVVATDPNNDGNIVLSYGAVIGDSLPTWNGGSY